MWSNFETTSIEDETVNNEFSTNGLFKISSDETNEKNPTVQAFIQSKKMIISLDKSLILIEDENIAECRFLSFGNAIDALVVSRSGNLVICGLNDGNIHGIYLKGLPVFNLMIQEKDIGVNSTFIGVQQIHNSFYIMCTSGQLYRIKNVEEKMLTESLINYDNNETQLLSETIMNNTTLEMVIKTKHTNIGKFCVIPFNNRKSIETENDDEYFKESTMLLYSTSECLFLQHKTSTEKVPLQPKYGGVKNIYNLNKQILILTNSGDMLEICPYTKLLYSYNLKDLCIDEMIIMESENDNMELLILTKMSKTKERLLKITEFPSFKCKHELELKDNIWLIQQPKSSMNMYYLKGYNKGHDIVQEIEIRIISETDPSNRLKKLIQRCHFEEAEVYAQQFDLCPQEIYEARARKMLHEISKLKDEETLMKQFEYFITYIPKITNKNFLLSIRITDIPSRDQMRYYLKYLLQHIDSKECADHIEDINDQILRLDTLKIIDPYCCYGLMEWQKFVHDKNLIKTCMNYFKSNISIACVIWSRHSSSIVKYMKISELNKILDAIPCNVEPFEILQWLKHFVPSVSQTFPPSIKILVDWCIKKTKSFQYSNLWPEIGLEFINNIYTIFADIKFFIEDMRRHYESSLNKIQSYVLSLQDLTVLKSSFNLIISLEDYIEESVEDTAFNLMKRIKIDNFKRLVDDFLYPIFMESGLLPEQAIMRYIKYITEYKNISFWQERAVIATELLHNEKNKLQCALLVLKAAPVPWSDVLNNLVKYGSSNHPLAEDIYIEYKTQSIKLIKMKYGWPADAIDDKMKLIYRIVEMDFPDMLEDIKNFVAVSPDIKGNAYFYYAFNLARNGHIDRAVIFIDSLTLEDRKECCIKTINIILKYLNEDEFESAEEEDNMKEYLKLIKNRLNDEKYDNLIKDMEKISFLRRNYNIHLDYEDLTDNAILNMVYFERGIQIMVCEVIGKTNSSNYFLEIIEKTNTLAKWLNINLLEGLYTVAGYVNNIRFTCSIIDYLFTTFEIDNLNIDCGLDLVILVIAQQIKCNVCEYDDCLAYPLAYQLLVHCSQKSITARMEIFELLKWIRLVCEFYPINIIEIERNRNKFDNVIVFDEIFEKFSKKITDLNEDKRKRDSLSVFDTTPVPSDNIKKSHKPDDVENANLAYIFDSVGASIKLLIALQPNDVKLFCKFRKYFTADDLVIDDVKETFFKHLENLFKFKLHSQAVNIIHYIMEKQAIDNLPIVVSEVFVSMIKRRAIKYMLSQKEPAYNEALVIFATEPSKKETLEYLEAALKNGSQKFAFLTLLEIYYGITEDFAKVETLKSKRMKYFYYTEFCKVDSQLKIKTINDFNMEFQSVGHILSELKNKILDVGILKKLCKDFNWNFQQVLITQIITILNVQELQFDVVTDIFGKEEIVVRTNTDEIKSLCIPFVDEITNVNLLVSKLHEYLNEVNFYFYELYLCVIEIIESVTSISPEMMLWKNILFFLKHKMTSKRRNRPGQIETDLWLKEKLEIGVLPNISKYRLPFKPLLDFQIEDILTAEVCVENIEKWLPLIRFIAILSNKRVVDLQEHYCMLAVKNSISNYKNKTDDQLTEIWQLTPTNNGFLQLILHMIQFLVDKAKIAFVLYFVANHAPEGADQVEAAYECYRYCIENEDILMEKKKTEEIVVKIKRKYPIYKTQHLLNLYKLNDEKLFQYLENPVELINALYHHEVILQTQKPDVHKLANEIAELHSLDLQLIHMNLLHKWLRCDSESADDDLEETVYDDFLQANDESLSQINNDESVMRSFYILSSMEPEKAMNFLIYSFEGSSNTAKQLLLCDCFTKLLDEDNTTYNEIVNQTQYIALKICHSLKNLGYKFGTDKFISMDKLTFLKKLWQNNANNSKSLEIMAYICLGFEIYLPQIWNSILKQMCNLDMIKELTSLIDLLSTKSSLLHTQGLISAYECIVKSEFKNAISIRNAEQEQLLARALLILQKCPVSAHLNLKELADTCMLVNRPHMAAIMLAYTDNEDMKNDIINMIRANPVENLKKDIIDLEEFGIISLTTNYVINQLEL